jgi:hypothetical protein
LQVGTREIDLTTRFVPHDFRGDEAIDCTLVAGPCRDFNAMFRRGRARGSVTSCVARARSSIRRSSACRMRPGDPRSDDCAALRAPADEGHALVAPSLCRLRRRIDRRAAA